MSVATTESARRRACRAWMPHPVPRSSTRPVSPGNCRPLSVTDAPPTPSTWSGRSGPRVASSPRSLAIHQAPAPRESTKEYGRRSTSGATRSPSTSRSSRAIAPSTPRLGRARSAADRSTSTPSTNRPARIAAESSESASARSAGTRLARRSAASAVAPHSRSRRSTVNRAAVRSARRRSTSAASTAPSNHGGRVATAQSSMRERTLPAGSVNQAMSGPMFAALPLKMPRSSCPPGIES